MYLTFAHTVKYIFTKTTILHGIIDYGQVQFNCTSCKDLVLTEIQVYISRQHSCRKLNKMQ